MGFTNQSQWICIALILSLGALASQATARTLQDESMRERHEQWMAHYGRVYEDNYEKENRFKICKENVARIESSNSDANKSYKLKFKALRNRYKGHECSTETTSFKYENVTALPSSMDWRKKGAVTPIKDQGQCGCCWAFSAMAAMEGITQLTTGKLISLSKQELVDCDTKGVDQGCQGEANCPYMGVDGTCNANEEANDAAKIIGYEDVPANSEQALLKAVANQPVSVAIDAGGFEFQFYSTGVLTGPCGTSLDHGVTVVGYGGTQWGEEGYMQMQRDVAAKEGLCGIAMEASYPTA
ncbi:hypothetical protein RGQ29_028046 [Quercus rubra]|uniref:Uncharacterized protein n=1 Tax=Quercus rubra TaxID=3512 RepID=A0AAN7ER66_QUERU|nr:hypothetical protein RGQ29_028046 [Quercus rubra]